MNRHLFSCRGVLDKLATIACFGALLVALEADVAVHWSSPQDSVPTVRIDAVVTDARGHAIVGLRPSDFELRDDGSLRPLSAAEFRSIPRHSTVELLPVTTHPSEERAARQADTRVFAFFLDEFHVSAGASADRVRQAVASFVDEKLHERDLAAVIRPLDSVSSIRFTRDRGLIHGNISGFAGRKGEYAPRTPMEERLVGRDPEVVRGARQQLVRQNLGELGVRLGELNAERAVIVLVSEGFPCDPSAQESQKSDLWDLLRRSSQFHFSIYTFNPARSGESTGIIDDVGERDLRTLQWLASETGGLFVPADAFIAGFARLFHDTLGYYALTYQPGHADARFHRLEVRTRRAGYVRTRTNYWALAGNERNAATSSRAPSESVDGRLLRRSAMIDAWIGIRRDGAGPTSMVITWEPRTGQFRRPQTVAIRARTVTGRHLFEGSIEPVRGAIGPQNDSARFEVPTGRVEVDMTVLNADGAVIDTDVRDFDVPDLGPTSKAGPLLLSTEIVRARTQRELQAAKADSDATPSASRTFGREVHLLIRAWALDPTGNPAKIRAQLLGRIGQRIRDIETTSGAFDNGVTQFLLPLHWLAPGPYQIELSATNANGTVRERLAFQVE
jgi:VWFA-related protein